MSHRSGFNYTTRMRAVCVEIAQQVPELRHVDVSRVAFSFSQARNRSQWGVFASLTPLRFQGGAVRSVKRGRLYAIQQVNDPAGCEMLYILTFYLPRFHDQTFREKLITIFHELWHISPLFNGDLRRHEGRCYVHTGSQANYDAHMGQLVDRWLEATRPLETLLDFLQDDFQTLFAKHGGVFGDRYQRPKLISISA